jgi:hypothetical protein
VQRLIEISNDPAKKNDNTSRAAAYYHLKKLKSVLEQAIGGDIQKKAHRSILIYLIDKNLSTRK